MIDPTPSVQQLRDGTPVVVRAVRPSDRPLIESGFRALSPRSRLDRFLVPVRELGEERLAFLHQLDCSQQAAVGALTLHGQGVAIARFARVPADPRAAEVGITVVDDYQGRGVGTLLFRELARIAMERGIRRFVGVVRTANRRAIDPLRRVASSLRPDGPVCSRSRWTWSAWSRPGRAEYPARGPATSGRLDPDVRLGDGRTKSLV